MGRLNRTDKNYHLSAAALTDTGPDCLISSFTGGRNWKALIIQGGTGEVVAVKLEWN